MTSMLARVAAVCALLASIAMSAASPARADEPDFVDWRAPAGCPDAAAVRADVKRLGGVAVAGDSATVIAVSHGARWRATIALGGRGGSRERVVEAATCKSVAEAAALVVALAFPAPEVPASPIEPAPRSEPARPVEPASPIDPAKPIEPAVAPPIVAREAPARVASSARAPFAAGAAAGAIAGALPSTAPGVALSIAWLPRRVRVELGAIASGAESASVIGAPVGADFRVLGASARACASLLALGPFALAPCAGIEADRIHAAGFGSRASRDVDETRGAGLFGALATFAIDRPLVLRLGVDGVVPFARPRFVVNVDDLILVEVHRPAAIWGRALLGAEVRF